MDEAVCHDVVAQTALPMLTVGVAGNRLKPRIVTGARYDDATFCGSQHSAVGHGRPWGMPWEDILGIFGWGSIGFHLCAEGTGDREHR